MCGDDRLAPSLGKHSIDNLHETLGLFPEVSAPVVRDRVQETLATSSERRLPISYKSHQVGKNLQVDSQLLPWLTRTPGDAARA